MSFVFVHRAFAYKGVSLQLLQQHLLALMFLQCNHESHWLIAPVL